MKKTLTIIPSIVVVIVSTVAALLYVRTQKLQSDNSKLTAQLADANSQLSAANQELDAANQQIAQMKPDVERARTMPIVITRAPALMGSGYFYSFHNLLRKPLALHVIFTNPAFGQPMEFRLVIDGGMRKNIGHLQGWSGAAGDAVKVECAGYDPIEKSYQ